MSEIFENPELEVVKPTEDMMFRKLFSSEEHLDVIAGFLNEVLRMKANPEDIRIKNPYSIKSYLEEQQKTEMEIAEAEAIGDVEKVIKLRQTIRDVTLSVIDVGDVTIEMQMLNQDYFMERLHYYLDELYVSNYNQNIKKDGIKYSSLRRVISLNVLGFDLFEDQRPLRSFTYRDDKTKKRLRPNLKQIGFLELGKTGRGKRVLRAWQSFLVTGVEPPYATKAIKKAAKIVQYNNLDPEERKVIDRSERAYQTGLAILSNVRKEGAQERDREFATGLFRDGIAFEMVAKHSSLETRELRELFDAANRDNPGS